MDASKGTPPEATAIAHEGEASAPEKNTGVSVRATPYSITITQQLPTEERIQYFAVTKCSPEEQKENELKARLLGGGTSLIGGALAFTGIGALPGGALAAAGSVAAQHLRDACRADGNEEFGSSIVKGVISTGVDTALSIVLPVAGGVATQFISGGASSVADYATGKGVDLVNEHLREQDGKAEQEEHHDPHKPRELITHPRKFTEHQLKQIRAASQAMKEAVVCEGKTPEACEAALGELAHNAQLSPEKKMEMAKTTGIY